MILLVFCVNATAINVIVNQAVKMLKRLTQKIRKLQSYVRSRLNKNEPKSSKIHDLIKNNATQKKSTHKQVIKKYNKK